jgi:sporulation-control protein
MEMPRRVLNRFGIGGPAVGTMLDSPFVRPGEALCGQARIVGGASAAEIEYVSVGLATRVEVELGRFGSLVEFDTQRVVCPFTLAAKELRSIPFELPVPIRTPITSAYGQPLPGMTMWVRTGLSVARGINKRDHEPVMVNPLPTQELVLQAFDQLGFGLKGADLSRGPLRAVRYAAQLSQKIEFHPPWHARDVDDVTVTFVADRVGMNVILEADKHGLLIEGEHAFRHFRFDHATATRVNIAAEIDRWIRGTAK